MRGALLVVALGQGVEHQLQSISVPSPLGRWQAVTAPLLQPCQNGAALGLQAGAGAQGRPECRGQCNPQHRHRTDPESLPLAALQRGRALGTCHHKPRRRGTRHDGHAHRPRRQRPPDGVQRRAVGLLHGQRTEHGLALQGGLQVGRHAGQFFQRYTQAHRAAELLGQGLRDGLGDGLHVLVRGALATGAQPVQRPGGTGAAHAHQHREHPQADAPAQVLPRAVIPHGRAPPVAACLAGCAGAQRPTARAGPARPGPGAWPRPAAGARPAARVPHRHTA